MQESIARAGVGIFGFRWRDDNHLYKKLGMHANLSHRGVAYMTRLLTKRQKVIFPV